MADDSQINIRDNKDDVIHRDNLENSYKIIILVMQIPERFK